MHSCLLDNLKSEFQRCSDCLLSSKYSSLLNDLVHIELSQELVDYLCEKTASKKHIWEIKYMHLRVLLLNTSSQKFDLKAFYLDSFKKSRRLALKIFYIRGYAIYASEDELSHVLDKFRENLEKNHDYIDYNYILSAAGLPYLVNTYGYDCLSQALKKAEEEYEKIDSLLKGFFTINSNLEQEKLLSDDELRKRTEAFLAKHRG